MNEPVEYNIKKNVNPQNHKIANSKTQENTNSQFKENKNIQIRDIDNQNIDSKSETIAKPEDNENKMNMNSSLKDSFKNNKKFWITGIIVLVCVIILAISIPIALRNKNKDKDKNNNLEINGEEEVIIQNPEINLEVAKEIFSPSFKINTKENVLIQLSQKSHQNYQTTVNGEKTTMSIINKAIFDIYTINSTSSSKQNKIIYDSIYTTIITVNSLCAKLSHDLSDNDCELEQYLNLNKKDNSNLRTIDENDEYLLREAIIPMCLVEHTDTNLIISVTCPENLDDSFKNDIIRAFQNIKPDTMKGYEYDKNLVDTITEERDDKIYVTSYDNVCTDPNTDPTKTIICNLTKNIVTDKEGNLIFSKNIRIENTTKNENNSFINSFTYECENIPKEKSTSFNQEIFEENYKSLLSMIKPFMKKEIFIPSFKDFVEDLMLDDPSENQSTLRYLFEQDSSSNKFIQEENIYNRTFSTNFSVFFNLKNDIGLGQDNNAKAISNQNVNGENITELSDQRKMSNLNETLYKFIILSKSGNILAQKLYEKLNDPLLKLGDIVSNNIEAINKLLANKDLSIIFDSTLAIYQLESLNYEFVAETDNLYNSMNELSTNYLYVINNARELLKNEINNYIKNTHDLIFKLFDKLSDATNALSSEKSKIADVSSYYLNNTNISYYDQIMNATKILKNYYNDEVNNIIPLVNNIIRYFYGNTTQIIQKYEDELDVISERLNNGDLSIPHSSAEVYQKTITNIYNTKLKAHEIIENIKNKFDEIINLKSNGYFESQQEIDDNNKTYGQKAEKALTIAYNLDNNLLIDKTFDTIMISFRDQFLNLLKYMENSIKTNFPLEENALGSLFDERYNTDLDSFLLEKKKEIITFITDENKQYLEGVNKNMSSFKSDKGKNLDQIISDLLNELNITYLSNINTAYQNSLNLTLESISQIIENNKNNAYGYLNDGNIASSYHITTGFINKYNLFYNSFIEIENFVNKKLKNNLVNKYKNVINQIRGNLQSIKSNKILQKYYKQLPTAERHLNSINELFTIFNQYFSDSVFNINYLPSINDFIKKTNHSLNQIKQNIVNIYTTISKKSKNNILQDYDKERRVSQGSYCCRLTWYRKCLRYCPNPDKFYYDGYNVAGTNNHLNLKTINFEDYIIEFDDKYREFYPNFSENVLEYNDLLSNLDTLIESRKNDYIDKENQYLKNISEKVDSILEQKYGNILLQTSYDYFKNKITNLLPNELNNILNQWSNVFDQTYEDINSNKNKLKSSVEEFSYIAIFYSATYTQNISYDYGEAIVEKLKNEFDYTNKYYYNLLISKINFTYQYILSNLPKNEKPFDEILNLRISQIKNSNKEILSKIQKSKNEILDKNYQKTFLKITDKNFFLINDIISNHIKVFENTLNTKIGNLYSISDEISNTNPEELIVARFYLGNSINAKQTKMIYNEMLSTTFIDLQNNEYYKLIDKAWNVDKDGMVNNILNTLKEINENNNNKFKSKKEEYINILENKLYSEFYTKKNLDDKITSLFEKGILKSLDVNSKNQIYSFIDLILNKIKIHMSNEKSRLSNELTSYSKSFTVIKNILNNYKKNIYEQFYSAITNIVNDFHEQISEKFYKNYIKKGLNEFQNHIDETDFGIAQFLNMSINLNEIIDKESKLIINEYNNLTVNKIEYLFQKHIDDLNNIFNFSMMKSKIFDEIDRSFNLILLPQLQNVSIYNSGEEGISDYTFSSIIIDDIDTCLSEQINKTKQIINKMEGNKQDLQNLPVADFTETKEEKIYSKIKNMFSEFTETSTYQEKIEIMSKVGNNTLDNFKLLIDNFLLSFGSDYFDRILKFNEIQKIKLLYNNLQYSLAQTISYYSILSSIYEDLQLPEDIILNLLTLNNLDVIVNKKNEEIISDLNNKFNGFLEETKIYIVEKYINDMIQNIKLNSDFKDNIKDIINGIISGNKFNYEKQYINKIEEIIKNPFIEKYKSTLNSATENIKYYIEDSKIELRVELDSIFILDSDLILNDIQKKLNETSLAIEEYEKHNKTIQISKEVSNFLDNFGKDYLVSKYNNIQEILNKLTSEFVINNLESLSNEFRNEYSIYNFTEEVNKIDKNLSSYFNEYIKILDNYGHIKDIYANNLNNEKINYRNQLRGLQENSLNEKKFVDIKLEKSFNELKDTSLLTKNSIENLYLFTNFDENLDRYINDKSDQYTYSQTVLDKNRAKNENYDLMNSRLNELYNISSEYYSQVKLIYQTLKEKIIEQINIINELIYSCEKITIETIIDEYNTIKLHFDKIEEKNSIDKNEIVIEPVTLNQPEMYFTLVTKIQNYHVDYKISVDLLYESDSKTPKVRGRLENNIQPKLYNLDFYSTIGQKDKVGTNISLIFHNISSYIDILFDAGTNEAKIIKNFYYDEYNYGIVQYQEITVPIKKKIRGIEFIFNVTRINPNVSTEYLPVDPINKTIIEDYEF